MEPTRSQGSPWWRLLAVGGLALALGMGLWINTEAPARAAEPKSGSRSSRASENEETAGKTNAKVAAKLDEILENQQQILKRLDQVMEELKIVKIRATMR